MQFIPTICLIPLLTSCVEPNPTPSRDHSVARIGSTALEARVAMPPDEPVEEMISTYIRVMPSFLGAPCVGAMDVLSTTGDSIPVPVAPLWDTRFHPMGSDAEVSRVRCLETGEDHDFDTVRLSTTVRIRLREPSDPEWVCSRIAISGTVLSEPYHGTLVESAFSDYIMEGEFFTGQEIELLGLSDRPHAVIDIRAQCRDELMTDRAWPSWVGAVID